MRGTLVEQVQEMLPKAVWGLVRLNQDRDGKYYVEYEHIGNGRFYRRVVDLGEYSGLASWIGGDWCVYFSQFENRYSASVEDCVTGGVAGTTHDGDTLIEAVRGLHEHGVRFSQV